MFGFWKKEWEKTARELSEEQLRRAKLEKNLLEESKKTDKLARNKEEAIKALISDNMTGYVKCGNELLKVCVQNFSGSTGELPEINCVVIKDA